MPLLGLTPHKWTMCLLETEACSAAKPSGSAGRETLSVQDLSPQRAFRSHIHRDRTPKGSSPPRMRESQTVPTATLVLGHLEGPFCPQVPRDTGGCPASPSSRRLSSGCVSLNGGWSLSDQQTRNQSWETISSSNPLGRGRTYFPEVALLWEKWRKI